MQLETPRLILREFKASDWKDVHEYAAEPDVVKYMEWGPNTSQETIDFVDDSLEKQREKPRRFFELAVIERASGKLIGAVGLRLLPHDAEQAEVGYCYNNKYWRQGYASEACRQLIQFGFESLQLHRIMAMCDAENIGSARVLSKSGMRQEAHFRQNKKMKGRWRDSLLFAVLRSEWT